MNIDIIALATKCGFSTVEDRTIYLSKYSKEKLHDCILKLATLLEAEIRKEFEAELSMHKAALSIRYEPTEALVMRIEALTEQNAKLIEALKQAEREQREAVREAASEAARQERFPDEPCGTY